MHQRMLYRSPIYLLGIFLFLVAKEMIFADGPKVNYLFPAGAQVGQKSTIQAFGEFATWPVNVWCEQKPVTLTAEREKGKFKLELADNAVPGVSWLRFFNETGASSVRPFMISPFPEREEVEPNDTIQNAQVLPRDIVVNGRLANANDVDGFVLELAAGEKCVATLQAHSVLGSPMDAVLQVCEIVQQQVSSIPNSERMESFVLEQNHDSLGLDPAITFVAPHAGRYLVRLFATPAEPDSSIIFAGKESYVYRLTITSHDFDPIQLLPPTRNHFPLVRESNNADKPLSLPAILTQIFTTPDRSHIYAFTASKGKHISFNTATRSLGFPTELSLKVTDRSGNIVARAEKKEPKQELELIFIPPADDVFLVQVSDLFQRAGLRYSYQINLVAPEQEFAIRSATDVFVIQPSQTLEIPLVVDRRHGFSGAIEIRATALPSGVSAEPVISEGKGESAKTVKLVLKAAADAPLLSVPFAISASCGTLQRQATYASTLPLDQPHSEFWLTVRK